MKNQFIDIPAVDQVPQETSETESHVQGLPRGALEMDACDAVREARWGKREDLDYDSVTAEA